MSALRYLLFILCLMPGISRAAGDTLEWVSLGEDQLPWILNERWRYLPGDDLRRADPAFPDSGWMVRGNILKAAESRKIFPGIGWWRRPVYIDSTLAGRPLALVMKQRGASEVYIDGRLIRRFGIIDSSGRLGEHYAATGKPFVFILPRADTYLVAVRYASLGQTDPGFSLYVHAANQAITNDRNSVMSITGIALFFIGIFLAFSLLHAVMYYNYRAAKSNIWFALFSLCLSVLIGLLLILVTPFVEITNFYLKWLPVIVLVACFALSGFINSVFFKRRPWLRYLMIAAIPFTFISELVAYRIMVMAIIAVSFETIFTIVFAMYRKRPGARIIGTGLLLFSAMMLYVFGRVVIMGEAGLDFEGPGAIVTLLLTFAAIFCIPLSMSAFLARSFVTLNRSLQTQLTEVERLSAVTHAQELEKQRLLESRREELEQEVAVRTEELRGQKQKSDDLLRNILPAEVAEELKENGQSAARQYNEVSVLFTDFVDFTQRSERLSPAELVSEINECFSAFDGIITRHGLEKIKTVGDAYIAVSGMPTENPTHAVDVVGAALEIRDFMEARRQQHPFSFGIRLGVHSGPVVAGIVGVKKFAYDIWGDTVNTAARMEQHSEPGRLNISETTYALVRDTFHCEQRDEMEVKHKGRMRMYFVLSPAGGGSTESRPGEVQAVGQGRGADAAL